MSSYRKLHAKFNELGFWLDGTREDAPSIFGPTARLPYPTEEQVRTFEVSQNIVFPDDFREFILHNYCDAMPHDKFYYMQFYGLNFLSEVPVPSGVQSSENSRLFEFCDHLMKARVWAIDCGPGAGRGRVVELTKTNPQNFDSFGDFVDEFIDDPYSLATF